MEVDGKPGLVPRRNDRRGQRAQGKVKLTFAHGANIPDPDKLFNAGLDGNARRAIDFLEGDDINESALKKLVRAAIDYNKNNLKKNAPATGESAQKQRGVTPTLLPTDCPASWRFFAAPASLRQASDARIRARRAGWMARLALLQFGERNARRSEGTFGQFRRSVAEKPGSRQARIGSNPLQQAFRLKPLPRSRRCGSCLCRRPGAPVVGRSSLAKMLA